MLSQIFYFIVRMGISLEIFYPIFKWAWVNFAKRLLKTFDSGNLIVGQCCVLNRALLELFRIGPLGL